MIFIQVLKLNENWFTIILVFIYHSTLTDLYLAMHLVSHNDIWSSVLIFSSIKTFVFLYPFIIGKNKRMFTFCVLYEWIWEMKLLFIDYLGSFLYDVVFNIPESRASSLKPHLQLLLSKLAQEVGQNYLMWFSLSPNALSGCSNMIVANQEAGFRLLSWKLPS